MGDKLLALLPFSTFRPIRQFADFEGLLRYRRSAEPTINLGDTMKYLRLLVCSIAMTISFGLITPVPAQSGCGSGQIPTSCGCYDPGIMQTPPCAIAHATDDPVEPSQAATLPVNEAFDLTSVVE